MRRTPIAFLAIAAAMTILAGPAFAAGPASPRWSSTAPFGAWNNSGLIIYNNEWNQPTGPQRIWADSYHSWGAQSNQAAGNTAVETYPCVQKDYNNPQVMSFHLIRNGFTESMPHASGLDAEAADDIWLNKYKIEVMIWVDNKGQRPSGDIIGHATIFGQHFAVWHGGTDYTFALDHNETTGVTHILASIAWLIHHGQVASNATLTQVNFGWEIASTGGRKLGFKVSSYWLHSKQ
ncbi:MAG TPA: hypothetical protein VGM14_15570 [Streptosporangiaceae bacterium]